jgi:uncharacterized SAM-binding protein YcdF (DUF218 family)
VIVRRVVLLAVPLLVAGYLAVTLAQVALEGRSRALPPVDAVVVMGAAQYDGRPSAQLASRLDHVVTLWEMGGVGRVVVTGGSRPGDRFSEAAASEEYLVAWGVPRSSIVSEDLGTTTWESMQEVKALLDADASMIIVTDPHHGLRSRLIAEEAGFTDVAVSTTPTSVVSGWTAVRRHLVESAGVALGRLVGFERLSGRG